MDTVAPEAIVNQLNWRYATKKFDPTRKISAADWVALEQALVLAPSSYGLQPSKFVVVTDPTTRAALRAAAYGQAQVTDASHLVVFAARTDMNPADVDRLIARVADVRNVTTESLAGYRNMMIPGVSRPPAEARAWAARQVYIALGVFLTSAALLGIDACPMEGFDPAQYDQVLGLGAQGYTAVAIATAGYRAADDPYAKLPKVRFKAEELIAHVK